MEDKKWQPNFTNEEVDMLTDLGVDKQLILCFFLFIYNTASCHKTSKR